MKLDLPLPLYGSHALGSVKAKTGQEFNVVVGLDEKLVAQLKRRSLDADDIELQNNTSDHKRFGEGSYETWYSKKRIPFAALDAEGELAALIWFGPEEPPSTIETDRMGEWDTVAFRSYSPYRGVGLMRSFSELAFARYRETKSGRKIWLETNADNDAATALYRKLGFEDRGMHNGRRVMVQFDDSTAKG